MFSGFILEAFRSGVTQRPKDLIAVGLNAFKHLAFRARLFKASLA